MDKFTANKLSERVLEHLKALEEELNVSFSRGNGKYDDVSFTMKLQITENGEGGEKQDKLAADFKKYAVSYGMKPEDLGKTIMLRGTRYTIVGLKPSYRKYPIICEGPQGGKIKLDVHTCGMAMKASEEV